MAGKLRNRIRRLDGMFREDGRRAMSEGPNGFKFSRKWLDE